ncbi:CaiB/BaiF CoA transferase family protein [Streptomyces antimycoticus]|uniref:CaiB/BaiF CoA transferase family protein n=1 Tax=Streptomyces antimycoticus TaxID=68175 RepID=UPI000A3A8F9D|nr:CoA transferase [Streptomyces antimycoticus]
MSARPNSDRPLDGVRVIDLTTSYAGPTASMYLADLGATVIKVERPGGGDDARGWGPPFVDGTSAWFATANRNKASVVLDLGQEPGRDALRRLVGSADVFMQNMNPSKLQRLGIDAESLLARRPSLVYCALSGFGLDGPDSHLPGYDLVAQARSGLMSVTGELGRAPQRVSTALSDVVTGMCAAIAISAALVRQARRGTGEIIDVSLLDTDLALMAPRIGAFHAGDPEPAPSGGTDSVLAVYQPFQTADRVIVIAIGNDAMWQRFCAATGLEDLGADPDLRDNTGRRAHRTRVTERIGQVLATRKAADWLAVMEAVSVPAAMVQSLSEVVEDPQVVARGALMEVPGSNGGLVTVRSPFRLRTSMDPRNEASPALGADTERVLLELGYTPDEAAELARRGSAAAAPSAREATS